MKRNRYSEEQITKILRDAEKGDKTIGQLCKEYGISEYSFYRWRKQYSGMQVAEIRRLKALEKENARLKRIVAERDLEIDIIKEVLEKK